MKKNKGFTLIELMIVMVIIGALTSFMALVFNVYIERGREATDLANVRNACDLLSAAAISKDYVAEYDGVRMFQNGDYVCEVQLKQRLLGWQTKKELSILGISNREGFGYRWLFVPLDKDSHTCKVTYNTTNEEITLDWAGGSIQIPHIYEYTLGQSMVVHWNKQKENVRYIKLVNPPINSGENERQVTALSEYLDLDGQKGITFQTPNRREVAKYINVNDYTYHVAVEFVNPADKRAFGNGALAVAANGDHSETEIPWNKEFSLTTSGSPETTKAMLQFEKKDKNGHSVRMSKLEIDYLMSLYCNPNSTTNE